jgi:hypothetical protein
MPGYYRRDQKARNQAFNAWTIACSSPPEQFGAAPALQCLYLLRDGARGDTEFSSGQGEAAVAGRGFKGAQGVQGRRPGGYDFSGLHVYRFSMPKKQ